MSPRRCRRTSSSTCATTWAWGKRIRISASKLGPNAAPVSKTLVTPNLDRLAAMGTVFTDVHTGSSMCSPTRYALLTGRYAWRSYNNTPSHRRLELAAADCAGPANAGHAAQATGLSDRGVREVASGLDLASDQRHSRALWQRHRRPTGRRSWSARTPTAAMSPTSSMARWRMVLITSSASAANFTNDSAGRHQSATSRTIPIQGIPTWDGAPPQSGVGWRRPRRAGLGPAAHGRALHEQGARLH